MNLINNLCAALDRLFERHPVAAFALMIAIAFVCVIVSDIALGD